MPQRRQLRYGRAGLWPRVELRARRQQPVRASTVRVLGPPRRQSRQHDMRRRARRCRQRIRSHVQLTRQRDVEHAVVCRRARVEERGARRRDLEQCGVARTLQPVAPEQQRRQVGPAQRPLVDPPVPHGLAEGHAPSEQDLGDIAQRDQQPDEPPANRLLELGRGSCALMRDAV
eukprot:7190460-Prymnesium_polylepis.2